MFLRCTQDILVSGEKIKVFCLSLSLDEHVFHELTEKELRQLMNEIALPLEECQTIKNDVKSRLDA